MALFAAAVGGRRGRRRAPAGAAAASRPAGATSCPARRQSRSTSHGTEVEVGWLGRSRRVRVRRRLRRGRRRPVDGSSASTAAGGSSSSTTASRRPYDVFVDGDRVDVESRRGHVALTRKPRFVDPADQVAEGSLLAPMPGTVVAVRAAPGDEVGAGPAGAGPRGDEDAAHHHRAVRRGRRRAAGRRSATRSPPATSWPSSDQPRHERTTRPREQRMTDDHLHRARGADRAARGGAQARRQLRPRVHRRPGARRARRPPSCGSDMGKHGYLGVSLPEEYGGGGGGIADLAAVLEEAAAAGAPLLLMVVSPAICGTVIARYGTEEQKAALAARHRRRHRSRWPSRSPSPTPARTPTTSSRRPRRTATATCSTAARPTSPGSTRPTPCSSSAGWRTRRTGKLKPALFVVPTDSRGLRGPADRDGLRRPGEAVHALLRRRAPAARTRSSATRTPG